MEEENKEIQKYNSEYIEKLKAAFIEVGETIIETVKPVIKAVAEVVKDMHNTIIEACKTDPEVKKCYGIYKRTKKRKDQKEANKQNNKNNRKEIY